jgi:TRAP transporter TAXI family solute receptor
MKNRFLSVSIPVLLFIIASFYITSQFIQPPPKKELVIATGNKNGAYYQTALEYKKRLEAQKIKVTLLQTAGSVENIQLLKAKKVDIAFAQNGIAMPDNTLEFLGNIYYEPLWIFYKNEQYQMDYVIQLISKHIALGNEGSGTKYLSEIILTDNGITEQNSTLLHMGTKDAAEKLIKGELGAMFVVSSAQSHTVKSLLENPNINVLSIKRARAYSRKYNYLEALKLYEGTIDLYKNLPDENINLLSTTATLLTHNEVPHELVRILLKNIKDIHSKKNLFAKDNQFPNLHNTKLPIHSEAKQYLTFGDTWLETIFPYWIASNIDRLKILLIPLLTLMIPLFKGVFPLYQWSMRSKIYRWYETLNDIDKEIPHLTQDALDEKEQFLEKLKIEIQNETRVPLSFMGEYYNLIMHIDLILSRISKQRSVLK